MTGQETALQFLKGFAEGDVEKIFGLLAEDFHFEGPFFRCSTASEYRSMLHTDPPEKSTISVQTLFEEGNQICAIYRFRKNKIDTMMAQLFVIEEGKIKGTTLIFDGRAFS